jgi:dTDP-glucose 4,6-dehydratase
VVTGGLGFIGSAFIRTVVASGVRVINLDKRTYAADPRRLSRCPEELLTNVTLDIKDPEVEALLQDAQPAAVVHFAAESHVTRSELAAELFHATNVEGTRALVEATIKAGVTSFLHISTDEVYGPCLKGSFSEEDKEPGAGRATSAYARSKALADDLVSGYSDELRVTIARPTNCFGPWQHPEKAVARWITRALRDLPLPVWGNGGQIRDWMYVEDVCKAVLLLLEKKVAGNYNIGPEGSEMTNLEVARTIARLVRGTEDSVYLTAYDRPDHDVRYAVDSSRLRHLGWAPSFEFVAGLEHTVEWYRRNEEWWKPLIDEAESIYSDEESTHPI